MNVVVPTALDLAGDDTVLQITWSDGHVGRHRLSVLRSLCPCAACCGHDPAESLNLTPEDFPSIRLLGAEPVGRYAYRFIWSDGHATGLYQLDFLRSLEDSG